MKRLSTANGVTLVEVLIGVGIMSLIIGLIVYTTSLFFAASERALDQTEAVYLAEEGIEILRYLRDADWATFDTDLSIGTTYYFAVTSAYVATTTVPEVIDGRFTRSFTLEEVERDGNDDVAISGTVDPDTKRVVMTVAWDTESVVLEALLANLYE